MSKVLVIGASGSIGSGLVELISNKHDVTGTYLNSKLTNDNISKIRLDISDKDSFEQLDTNYDAVVLIAGAMPASMEGYDQNQYVNVNITGTLNVLEFCRINNIKKVIYVMTFSDVSGSFYTGVPIKETDARTLTYTGDHAVYAISKVTACEMLEHYHQEHGLQTIIFRIPTVYCCDDNVNYYVDGKEKTKAYINMIRSVTSTNKIELWGDTHNAKDMPYIKDFSRLIDKAITHKTAQGLFNAGTGNPVTLDEFITAIIKVFSEGQDIKKTYKPENSSQPNFTFDMSKTSRTFDYHCEYGIEDMLLDIKKHVSPNLLK
jgi:UDP-glucose 4-epimerase